MPAFVNSSVGSSWGTSGELATMRWPFRSKYLRKEARISLEVILSIVGPGSARPKGRALLLKAPKVGEDAVGVEALSAQVAEETLELAVVGDALAAAEALLERRRKQRIGVEILKGLVHGA